MNVYMIHVSCIWKGKKDQRKHRYQWPASGVTSSCHEIDVTIAFFIQELEECPGISGTQVQRLEHSTDFVLFKESPWVFSLSCDSCQFTHTVDPGRVVKFQGTAALPEIFRSLRSCMILHAKKTILDHISLLACSWLGPPPPLGAWGLALGHLHIMIVRIETSSLSSYVSVFFNKLLRTANCEQPEKVAR